MPVKGTKDSTMSKHETVRTNYVSGTPLAPAAGHVCIYTDLTEGASVEIEARLNECIDRARESAFGGKTAETRYWYQPLAGGGKSKILTSIDPLDIVAGMVGIGVNANVKAAGPSTMIINVMFSEIMEWMSENDSLIAVP